MLETPIELRVEPARFRIDGYYVRDLHFSVRENLDETTNLVLGTGLNVQPAQAMQVLPPDVKLEVQFSKGEEDPLKFRVDLRLESVDGDEAESSPYSFALEVVGYFSMPEAEPSPETDATAGYNGLMILYSTAREILASVSNRAPFPALLLPTATFAAAKGEKPTAKKPRKAAKKKPSRTTGASRKAVKK